MEHQQTHSVSRQVLDPITVQCFSQTYLVGLHNACEVKRTIGCLARQLATSEGWIAAAAACQAITQYELEYLFSVGMEDGRVVDVTVRPIDWAKDRNDVVWIESESSDSPMGAFYFRQFLQRQSVGMFVASVNKSVVGYVMCIFHYGALEIHAIAVDPFYRRLGVGTAMIERLKESQHSHNVMCAVQEQYLNVHLFLKANSFRCVSVIENYHGDSQSSYFFRFKQAEA